MNETAYIVRRDTPAWRMQAWISFGVAVFACLAGLWYLPSSNVDHVGLAIGFFFCLFASLTLAKTIRDNRDERVDTNEWMMIAWIGFVASIALIAYHLTRMNVEGFARGYLVVSWLFLVSSAFTLSKTVRDEHESNLVDAATRMSPKGRPEGESAPKRVA